MTGAEDGSHRSTRSRPGAYLRMIGRVARRLVDHTRDYPQLKLDSGEAIIDQFPADRSRRLVRFYGRATLTNHRVVFQHARYYTRPDVLVKAVGGSDFDVLLEDISQISVRGWRRNLWFHPGFEGLRITTRSGASYSLQILGNIAERWAKQIDAIRAGQGPDAG